MTTTTTTTRRLVAAGVGLAITVPGALALAAPASAAAPADTQQMLEAMVAEEKLAHDVYVTLGDLYDARQFDRIAAAETRHAEAVRTVMDRYGVADPTAGDAVGEFDDAAVQALYDSFVARGSTSLAAAAQVGIDIEQLDIADLEKAIAGNPAADITAVLEALKAGSENHLAAFTRLASGQTAAGAQNGGRYSMQNGMQNGAGRGMGRGMGARGILGTQSGQGVGTGLGLQDGSCL